MWLLPPSLFRTRHHFLMLWRKTRTGQEVIFYGTASSLTNSLWWCLVSFMVPAIKTSEKATRVLSSAQGCCSQKGKKNERSWPNQQTINPTVYPSVKGTEWGVLVELEPLSTSQPRYVVIFCWGCPLARVSQSSCKLCNSNSSLSSQQATPYLTSRATTWSLPSADCTMKTQITASVCPNCSLAHLNVAHQTVQGDLWAVVWWQRWWSICRSAQRSLGDLIWEPEATFVSLSLTSTVDFR